MTYFDVDLKFSKELIIRERRSKETIHSRLCSSLNISCIVTEVSSEKLFVVRNGLLLRTLSQENGNRYSSCYIGTRKNVFQKSEYPFFKKKKRS